jgi:hypothetical protein
VVPDPFLYRLVVRLNDGREYLMQSAWLPPLGTLIVLGDTSLLGRVYEVELVGRADLVTFADIETDPGVTLPPPAVALVHATLVDE